MSIFGEDFKLMVSSKSNILFSLMFIALIINVSAAQTNLPFSEMPESDNINLVDKEQQCIYLNTIDSVNIDLPYVLITNKKLKRAIDNFNFDIPSQQDSMEPIYLYLKKTGKGIYEFWEIIPALGFDKPFFNNNTIGFCQTSIAYIFIDNSARKEVKIIKGNVKLFTILSDYQIMNIDPVLILDLENIDFDKPIDISL